MKWIDIDSWSRKPLIKKYSTYMFPYINIGAQMDVTGLYSYCKKEGISFYCAMIYGAVTAALSIENFKYRIIDEKPVLCDTLKPVFTYLPKGEEQFYLVKQDYCEDMLTFCRNAKVQAEALANESSHAYMHAPEDVEILYISCIPWIHYTHFIRTIEHGGKDNIPRISWGKYKKQKDGTMSMPFSVQVHHALMDGYHVGMYFEAVESWLASF